MKPCRECKREISEQAMTCPQCGAPYPTRERWAGWGIESKSGEVEQLHGDRETGDLEGSRIAGLALAQFAAAYSLIAQFGVYVAEGHGQHVFRLADLLRAL